MTEKLVLKTEGQKLKELDERNAMNTGGDNIPTSNYTSVKDNADE